MEVVALLNPHVAGDHQLWKRADQPAVLVSACTVLINSKKLVPRTRDWYYPGDSIAVAVVSRQTIADGPSLPPEQAFLARAMFRSSCRWWHFLSITDVL